MRQTNRLRTAWGSNPVPPVPETPDPSLIGQQGPDVATGREAELRGAPGAGQQAEHAAITLADHSYARCAAWAQPRDRRLKAPPAAVRLPTHRRPAERTATAWPGGTVTVPPSTGLPVSSSTAPAVATGTSPPRPMWSMGAGSRRPRPRRTAASPPGGVLPTGSTPPPCGCGRGGRPRSSGPGGWPGIRWRPCSTRSSSQPQVRAAMGFNEVRPRPRAGAPPATGPASVVVSGAASTHQVHGRGATEDERPAHAGDDGCGGVAAGLSEVQAVVTGLGVGLIARDDRALGALGTLRAGGLGRGLAV
jgi:hypothetical protein